MEHLHRVGEDRPTTSQDAQIMSSIKRSACTLTSSTSHDKQMEGIPERTGGTIGWATLR